MENLFNQAVIKVKDLTVSTDTQLRLYSLYKQVIIVIFQIINRNHLFDLRGNAICIKLKGVKIKVKHDAMKRIYTNGCCVK
jgi:acyl-CoA-binding protein